ncbi:MAG: HEAT repeat domain-containing protein [Planctomycetota bacterium]
MPWTQDARERDTPERGTPERDTPEASADATRALKRILFLTGGGALRAIARQEGSDWQVKDRAAWLTIPAAAVARVELEKDVLRAFERSLRDAFKVEDLPSSLDARAAAVALGLDSGLLQEAMTAAEVILRDFPTHRATRDVLLDRAALFRVPQVARDQGEGPAASDGAPGTGPTEAPAAAGPFEPILRFAAQNGRALREVCVLRLGESAHSGPERDALRATLAAELRAPQPGRRSFAALAQARLFPGEALEALFVHALRDTSVEVRAEAARAVGAAGDPGLVLPLVRVLEGSASTKMRRHAAEALGHTGYQTAVAPLVGRLSALAAAAKAGANAQRIPHSSIFIGRQFAYIQDFDVEVAQLQSVADPQVNVLIEGQALDAGVVGSVEYREMIVVERATIQRALQALTGARPGGHARDWIQWWERQAQ